MGGLLPPLSLSLPASPVCSSLDAPVRNLRPGTRALLSLASQRSRRRLQYSGGPCAHGRPRRTEAMPKILLVEDNELNRDMLTRRLTKKNYQVVLAVDGAEACTKAVAERP